MPKRIYMAGPGDAGPTHWISLPEGDDSPADTVHLKICGDDPHPELTTVGTLNEISASGGVCEGHRVRWHDGNGHEHSTSVDEIIRSAFILRERLRREELRELGLMR